MEQRIKFVWILSLACMLLIIAGQCYWLWNQYRYKNEEYMLVIKDRVMEAVALNDSLREKQPKKLFKESNKVTYQINWDLKTKQDSASLKENFANVIAIGINVQDTVSLASKVSSVLHSPYLLEDSIRVYDRTNDLSLLGFSKMLSQYRLQADAPFSLQRFDSLLTRLLDESFTTRLVHTPDSAYLWTETLERKGSGLFPVARITYPYNPLKRELVQVDVHIPPHALLLRMGGQLLGSLLLVLLLAVCLLFQIKTILKQRRVDELRKNFVNTMIHELKRPVQALKMCVAFLNDKAMRTDEQSMDEVVRDSLSELDNLSAYLRKLRDMTRADDEQTQLSLSTFDLKPVVEKLIRQHRAPEGKQVTFETHLADNLMIVADQVHLTNILSNLIENAVKYSGSTVHIRVDGVRHDHRLILTVADNGIGIPLSEQGKVFDKFYRCTNLPDRSLPGIGLGLSYVKLLTEAHGGCVTLTSQPGKGTTVTLTFTY